VASGEGGGSLTRDLVPSPLPLVPRCGVGCGHSCGRRRLIQLSGTWSTRHVHVATVEQVSVKHDTASQPDRPTAPNIRHAATV